jgi:hypothetical protein
MPSSPRPLWNGYDDADEDDLVALLDRTEKAANDPDDLTHKDVAGGLATAIAEHEATKQKLDDASYRPKLHDRAIEIAKSWRP